MLHTELFRLTIERVLNGHKSASLVTVCFYYSYSPFSTMTVGSMDVYLLSAYYRNYTADSITRGAQELRFIKE